MSLQWVNFKVGFSVSVLVAFCFSHVFEQVQVLFFNVGRLGLILITRRRARALAERASSQENLGLSPSSNEWPAPPPPVPQSRESLFHSFLRSVRSNRAEAQDQALSAIPTPSEGSSISWCSSNQSVNSQEEVIYEDVVPSEINASRDNISVDSIERNSDSSSDSEFSALESGDLSLAPAYAEMENQVNQLCQAVERMQASINSQGRNVSVKSSVTFQFLGVMSVRMYMNLLGIIKELVV